MKKLNKKFIISQEIK